MGLRIFFKQIMCNHYDSTYLCTVKKGNGFDDALFRCNDCGKIIDGYNTPAHVIEGFKVDLMKPGHVVVALDNGKSVSVHHSLIIENVKKGFWDIGKNAFNVSWSWMHDKENKKALENMKSSPLVMYAKMFAHDMKRLENGSTVVFTIKDGKIFLSILSSHLGYENARSKYRWEKKEEEDTMTFNLRKEGK